MTSLENLPTSAGTAFAEVWKGKSFRQGITHPWLLSISVLVAPAVASLGTPAPDLVSGDGSARAAVVNAVAVWGVMVLFIVALLAAWAWWAPNERLELRQDELVFTARGRRRSVHPDDLRAAVSLHVLVPTGATMHRFVLVDGRGRAQIVLNSLLWPDEILEEIAAALGLVIRVHRDLTGREAHALVPGSMRWFVRWY